MRAQSSIEYFIIAAMVMMFMVPIWVHVATTQTQTADELSLSYARNAVKQIADAASLVHSQGHPAKINIKVYVPKGVDNITVDGRTIVFSVYSAGQLTDVWYTSSAVMQGAGEIPTDEGYYQLDVISQDTYVELNRTV